MGNTFLKKMTEVFNLYPNRVFMIDGFSDISYKYSKLENDVCCANNFLDAHPRKPELIVLCLDNSFTFIVWFLASLTLGKNILVLNPNEDEEKVKYYLKNFSEEVMFIFEKKPTWFNGCYELLNSYEQMKDHYTVNFNENNLKESIVYIPTSATTGVSKLVPQRLGAILVNINSLIKHHQLNEKSIIASSLPLYHVNALYFSFMSSFFSGGTYLMFKFFDLKKIIDQIERYQATILSVVPVMLNNMVRNKEYIRAEKLNSIKYFVSAAAPLSTETARSIRFIFNKKIVQGYGLSEGINFSCTLPIDLILDEYVELMEKGKFPSIGISLGCNEIRVVNVEDEDCLENEEGELLIKGSNFFKGYLNTDSTDLFIDEYFKSGDVGYFKELNGNRYYFISGRKKEISKVNGSSVSLRELDDYYSRELKLPFDFFSVSFENIFKGEELALVCRFDGLDVESVFENLENEIYKMDLDKRPRIILFVRNQEIRVPSGKAKRWAFKENFLEFKQRRLLNNLIYKII